MDLRVLRYFMAVVREENIVRAAQTMHVTQPTLSRQLHELEDELGGELFIRGHRGCALVLTQRGLKLKKRAAELLDLAGRTKEEVSGCNDAIRGKLVIGCGESELMRQVGRVIRTLRERHGQVSFRLVSADAESVMESLDRGIIDFGIFIGTVDLNRYEYLKLSYEDSWGLLVNTETFTDTKDGITAADLLNIPLLTSSQQRIPQMFEPWLGYSFSKLNIVGEYNLVHNASILCEEGIACVLTLDRLVNTQGRHLRFIPLQPALTSNTYIAWKKYNYLNPLQSLFVEEIAKFCVLA
ncbi:MAG: LysR family transcriptional regulator [Succinivibrio sp.]|nr:LysR family transcriptional regulator [Succinivibrio sp.]